MVTIHFLGGTLETEYLGLFIGLLIILSPFVSMGIIIPFLRNVILNKKTKYILASYLLIVEFILLIGLLIPTHNSHDRKFNQAFMNWVTNKTTETKAALDKEADRMHDRRRKEDMIIDSIVGGIVILNAFGIIGLYSKRKLNKKMEQERVKP